MQSGGLLKHALIAFFIALVIYIAAYSIDQHLRTRKGPWRVTFTQQADGSPAIIVNQPKLNITNLKIVLAGETTANPEATVAFDVPQKPVPFGSVKFEDLTYLPGAVTLDLFGHEIELLPRTLFLNRKEHPWKSNTTIVLARTNKIPNLPAPPRVR